MIILIDDDISRGLVNQLIFDYFGISNVILTHDSFSGIRLCASCHKNLDFAFINLFMLDLEGVDVIHHIKRVNKKIPVFAFSALRDNNLIKLCKIAGFSGFIQGPLTFSKANEFLRQLRLKNTQKTFIYIPN